MFKKTISLVIVLVILITAIPAGAMRSLSIDGPDLNLPLREGEFTVIVVGPQMRPIPNASVKIGGLEQATDHSGAAVFKSQATAQEMIEVRAEGYMNVSRISKIESKGYCYIIMDRLKDKKTPYLTMVCAELNGEFYDMRTQKLIFNSFQERPVRILVQGEWAASDKGEYVVYQEGGMELRFKENEFVLSPGNLFAPGEPVMVKMAAADRTESEPVETQITVSAPALQSNGSLPDDLVLLDEGGVSGSMSGLPRFLNDPLKNVSLSMTPIPITCVVEENKNGTTTVRMSIGVATFTKNGDKWGREDWLKFKQSTENLSNDLRLLNNFANHYRLFDGGYNIAKGWKPSFKIGGYYEMTLDNNGSVVEQGGGAVITGGVRYEHTYQTFLGPTLIPVYFGFAVEPTAQAKIGLNYSNGKLSPKLDLSIGASLLANGGVGLKRFLSAGAEGGFTAKLKIPFTDPSKNIGFTLGVQLSLQAEALFIFKWEYKLISADIFEWSKQGGALDTSHSALELKLASRDYAHKKSSWNGSLKNRKPISPGYGQKEVSVDYMSTIKEWIMPNSMPQIVQYGDKMVLTYLENSLERSPENGLVLMYSVLENGQWREPEPVWDTGTSDLYARLEKYGDELFVIWQKQHGHVAGGIPPEEQLLDAASMVEICAARFDGKRFVDEQYLTNDKEMDLAPVLVHTDKGLTAVWASCESQHVLSGEGSYYIYTSILQGDYSWSNPEGMMQTSLIINDLDAAYINGRLDIAVNGTDFDGHTQIYIVHDGTLTPVPESANCTGMQYSGDMLYWHMDGRVYEYDSYKNYVVSEIDPGGESAVSASYTMIDGSKKAIAWTGVSDGLYGLFVSVDTGGAWGNPIKVIELAAGSVKYMDALLTDSGDWKFVMNTSDGNVQDAMHSLVYASVSERSDVSLSFVEARDYDRTRNGVQPITYEVKNISESVVRVYKLKVFDKERVYFNDKIDCNILSGDSEISTIHIKLPELRKLTEIQVMISAEGDTDMTDNHSSVLLGLTDLSLDSDLYAYHDMAAVAVNVSNMSKTPSSAKVSIFEDMKSAKPSWSAKSEQASDTESRLYIFYLDRAVIESGINGAKTLFAAVESSVPDYHSDNNSNPIVIYGNGRAKARPADFRP